MIRGQATRLNSNACDVCSLAGFAGPASAPTTVRKPSGWACDRWTERTQGQRQGSYRADDVKDCRETRFCGNRHRQRFRTDLPLSATLSRSGPREWQRDSRGANGALAHGQKRTIICLATIWTCGGRDGVFWCSARLKDSVWVDDEADVSKLSGGCIIHHFETDSRLTFME